MSIFSTKTTTNIINTQQEGGTILREGTSKYDFKSPAVLLTFDNDLTTDSSGNGIDFTNNGVTAGDGFDPRGNYAVFDGSSNFSLSSPTDLNDEIGTTITFGFWFKTTFTGDDNKLFIIDNGSAQNRIDTKLINGNALFFSSSVSGSIIFSGAVSLSHTDNVWRHLVFIIDDAGNRVYVNGVLQTLSYSNGNSSSKTFITCSNGNSTLYSIGRQYGLFYTGDMDDFFISGSSYSTNEVLDLYNSTKLQKTTTIIDNDLLVTGNVRSEYLTPAGMIITVAMDKAPLGYLKCDGSAVSRSVYSRLFDAIGTLYGSGDGSTTFNVPDLRGEFIRGFDDGRGVDSGRILGSTQSDLFKSHTHSITLLESSNGAHYNYLPQSKRLGDDPRVFRPGGNVSDTGGSETRPRNVAFLYCIKY